MNPIEQQIEIAKVCGWRNIHTRNCRFERSKTGQRLCGYHPNGGGTLLPHGETSNANTLPNYLRDLNATHEMEKVLTGQQTVEYIQALRLIIETHDDLHTVHWFAVVNATAAQRAEAFLRTIGKWKE